MDFNFSDIHEAIARAIPDREALVFRDRRLTHAQLAERSRRLANYLLSRGLRVSRERGELQGHESGQDHLALYLYNGNEYVEGMLGAFKSRVASFNVNYRYVEEELLYLLENSQARAMIFHSAFAEQVASIRERLPQLEVLIQVEDDSGHSLLPGAVEYEAALASVTDELPAIEPSAAITTLPGGPFERTFMPATRRSCMGRASTRLPGRGSSIPPMPRTWSPWKNWRKATS